MSPLVLDSPMSQPTLLVTHGPDQGKRFDVTASPFGIGRGVHNDLKLLDTEVSRQHARIVSNNGQLSIEDVGSSNGTYVNGKLVGSSPLLVGDRIRLGGSVLVVGMKGGVKPTRSPADRVDLVAENLPADQSAIIERVRSAPHEPLLTPTITAGGSVDVLARVAELATRPDLSDEQLLDAVLKLTLKAIGADRGCVLLTRGEGKAPKPIAFRARSRTDASERMPISRSIVDYVLKKREGVRTSDAMADSRFSASPSVLRAGITEAMCAPLETGTDLIGAVYLDIRREGGDVATADEDGRLSEDSLRVLVAIARQAAMAIENHRYQRALLKAERLAAVGETTALLSHHIKNILQGVQGGEYLLERGLNESDPELTRKGWGIVQRNQRRIYHLVMDMLSFSKDRQPSLQADDLADVLREIADEMAARADEVGAKIDVEVAGRLDGIRFDREGIHRAVLNVVVNALDALEDVSGGRLVLRADHDTNSDTLYITVTDTGPGIDPERLPHIFEAFESSKGSRGTGLGLAVTRKVLREHGGDVECESKVGEGTRFILHWPRIEAPAGSRSNVTDEYDIIE